MMPAFARLLLPRAADLVAVSLGFQVAAFVLSRSNPAYPTIWVVLSIAVFWATTQLLFRGQDTVPGWFRLFLLGSGFNLLCHGALTYLLILAPAPMAIPVAGGLLAAGLTALERRWLRSLLAQPKGGTLIVGFDPVALDLLPALPPVAGVLADDRAGVPADLPVLGNTGAFTQAVAAKRPSVVLLAMRDWPQEIRPRELLELSRSGIRFETVSRLYENVLERVCWRFLDPRDFLFRHLRFDNRQALILQAVYSNLIGLALLAVAFPILLICGAAVRLSGGSARVLEGIECMGYRGIPFSRLRFRMRTSDGRESRTGRVLRRLHLDGLPQLINVVRGEMALIGLPPVRLAFAVRLIELIPGYRHRFSVMPGCLSWGWAHLRGKAAQTDEISRWEYDLYQVLETSPALDAELVLRALHLAADAKEARA